MKKFYLKGKQIDSALHNKILRHQENVIIIANPGGTQLAMLSDDINVINNGTEIDINDPLLIHGLEAIGINIENSYIIRLSSNDEELYVTPKVVIYGIKDAKLR